MSNVVSSLIFACRNVDKTKHGDVGRAPVAAAQGMKVLGEVSRYNKALAKGADATLSVFNDMAKTSKIVDYAVKGTRWAVHNVNPLICVSSAIKVAMSDDKTSTAVKEVSALSTMFAGEAIAKKALPALVKKLPVGKKMRAVINGLLFVGASIASYSAGDYIGKDLAKNVKASWSLAPAKIDQMA